LAGLPELDHGFQAAEEAGQQGQNQGVNRLRKPGGGLGFRDGGAEAGAFGRQGGVCGGHLFGIMHNVKRGARIFFNMLALVWRPVQLFL
jgi:hypothetical protein